MVSTPTGQHDHPPVAEDSGQRVVVGIDGSPASLDALRWAARYAALTDARLEAVCAVSVPTGVGAVGTAFDAVELNWVDTATQTLDDALGTVSPDRSDHVKRTIVWAHPAGALIRAAEEADLLVVGSRGHGGFTGMLLGSVSAHVVAHAPCPVLVIRHAHTTSGQTTTTGNVASGNVGQ